MVVVMVIMLCSQLKVNQHYGVTCHVHLHQVGLLHAGF
jgi:hypothetical protein